MKDLSATIYTIVAIYAEALAYSIQVVEENKRTKNDRLVFIDFKTVLNSFLNVP